MKKSPSLTQETMPEILDAVPPTPGPVTGESQFVPSPDEANREPPSSSPIVGIVASAGGLDAFKKFFSAMPADSGLAFVLIPHLDPTHESLMVELLSKFTSMPVVEANQGMSVQRNRVHIIPPNHFLAISGGLLQLSESPKHRGWQTSIDFFLRSLAKDQGELAIGIVLSGTGSHGALGIREIKLAGGIVMAQDPKTAEYNQMPQNAIDTGIIDCVLPPDQMPEALLKYVAQSSLSYAAESSGERDSEGEDDNVPKLPEESNDLLDQFLDLLRSRTKYDFRPHRKPMILRRIQRRMGLARIDSMRDYLGFLKKHPEEVIVLYKDLLISVTAFFRDPEAYRILEQKLIPTLLGRQTGDMPIRVWVPGCATGEEAYSIAILLMEAVARAKAKISIQVFASDIDTDAIDIARAGIYPASVVGDLSSERLNRFFVMVDSDHYQICTQLRESVVFSQQNLIGDAPFSKLDLISCRNLLIYLEPAMQQKVIALFHFALVSNGFLMLGPSETIGKSTDLFESVSKKWRVFRRTGPARGELVSLPLNRTEERRNTLPHMQPLTLHRKNFKELTEQLVLSDYAPAAALINGRLEVLYVTGPLVNYLEFPRGELTKELLSMSRPGLRTILRTTCNTALKYGKTVVETDARVKRGGKYVRCSITVRPLTEPNDDEGVLLVVFQDRGPSQSFATASETAADPVEAETSRGEESRLAQQLEFELKSVSEELHSTIEEMENSNEKLKTSNEELMSVNEELQSVNEELETSKEELQSLNEEMSTMNNQLQDKVAELDKATDDLMNLMSSTEIATIFLDEKLNIKRFTPPTKSLLNLLTTDIGRPLRDIAPNFTDDKMLTECQQVLDKLHPIESEVETEEPRYYLRRILPYRTTDHHIGGVVLTFVDVTQRKQAEAQQRASDARHFAELHESSQRLQAILNTAADAIVTIDLSGKIDSINLATERLFAYRRDELIGQNFSLLMPSIFGGHHEGTSTDSVKLDLEVLLGKTREVLARHKDGSTFPVDLAISKVDHLGLYTGILRDITVRKQLQAHVLEIATDEQRRIGQELHDGTQQELTGLTLIAGALREFLESAITADGAAQSVGRTLAEDDYQRLRETAAKLTQGLNEANQHVQKLSHGIMPVQIDAEGLRSALAELAAATDEQQQTRCDFKFSGSAAIANNAIATQLYRIAQEALNNALKHSLADHIRISLSQETDEIILEICDNGIGFDPQPAPYAPSAAGGIGLRIMEYRASMLGGELQIDRNGGHGSTVRCTVPTVGVLI